MKRTAIELIIDGRVVAAQSVQATFGPHYRVEITTDPVTGETAFTCVRTHHGYEVDASDINGPLERIIEETVQRHPEYRVD